LADGDVDAEQVLAALVDDRVQQDRGLPGLTVADEQLALSATDRDHGVDGHDAGLHGLVDALPGDDTRRDHLDRPRLLGLYRRTSVQRRTPRLTRTPRRLQYVT